VICCHIPLFNGTPYKLSLVPVRLVVHGFCPNCAIFVLLFVPAIQLFRTYGTNSQLIPCNSRTILSIAGTSLAFLVILLVRRLFAANSLQPSKLVFLLYGCLYLLRAHRLQCTYNLFNCRCLFGCCISRCNSRKLLSVLRTWLLAVYCVCPCGTGYLERAY